MLGQTDTHLDLLFRIRSPQDDDAWTQFVKIYTPYVYRCCRRHGLQHADALDVVQEVFQAVTKGISGFEHNGRQGSFRHYLLKVTHSKLSNFFDCQARHPQGTGEDSMQEILATQPLAEPSVDAGKESLRGFFEEAVISVRAECRPATWRAFWLTVMERVPAREAACRLGMSTRAVYIAKSRVLKRLKERIREIVPAEWRNDRSVFSH